MQKTCFSPYLSGSLYSMWHCPLYISILPQLSDTSVSWFLTSWVTSHWPLSCSAHFLPILQISSSSSLFPFPSVSNILNQRVPWNYIDVCVIFNMCIFLERQSRPFITFSKRSRIPLKVKSSVTWYLWATSSTHIFLPATLWWFPSPFDRSDTSQLKASQWFSSPVLCVRH